MVEGSCGETGVGWAEARGNKQHGFFISVESGREQNIGFNFVVLDLKAIFLSLFFRLIMSLLFSCTKAYF